MCAKVHLHVSLRPTCVPSSSEGGGLGGGVIKFAYDFRIMPFPFLDFRYPLDGREWFFLFSYVKSCSTKVRRDDIYVQSHWRGKDVIKWFQYKNFWFIFISAASRWNGLWNEFYQTRLRPLGHSFFQATCFCVPYFRWNLSLFSAFCEHRKCGLLISWPKMLRIAHNIRSIFSFK